MCFGALCNRIRLIEEEAKFIYIFLTSHIFIVLFNINIIRDNHLTKVELLEQVQI